MSGQDVAEPAAPAAKRRGPRLFPVRRAAGPEPLPMRVIAPRHAPRDAAVRRVLAFGDVGALMFAVWAGIALIDGPITTAQLAWTPLTIPFWIAVFKAYGLYDRDIKRLSHSTVDDIPWVFHAVLVGSLLLWPFFRLVPAKPIYAREALLVAAIAFFAVILARSLMRRVAFLALGPDRVLFIGERPHVELILRKMADHPEYGLEPIGVLSTATDSVRSPLLPRLGPFVGKDLARTLLDHRIGRVLVAHGDLEEEQMLWLVRRCRELGVKVSVLPQLFDALGPSVEMDDLEGVTVLGITPPVLPSSSRVLKRALDLAIASLMLVLLAPVLAVIVVAVKLDSRGPAFFRQERIGLRGRRFKVIKFRTMGVGAEEHQAEMLAQSRDPGWLLIDDDPRVTRVGRRLRQWSLDELPQLWNVMCGEMSMVGPRPLIASESQQLEGWRLSRIDLTPGLTGLWQVLGRTSIPFEEMIKLDYLYVTNWSLWTDLRLMMRTFPVVLGRRGVN